jgi:outer membrane biosynthesis protein TonB
MTLRVTKRTAALVAASLGFALVPTVGEALVGAAQADAAGCPAVDPSVPAPIWGPVAPGVVAGTASIGVGAGHTTVHLLDIDLTNPAVGVAQLGDAATDARQVQAAAQGVTNAVAAVNGDLFHNTDDFRNVAPDGAMGAPGRVMKGWSVSQPALTITGGHAAAGWTHLRGQLLFTAAPAATARVEVAAADATAGKPAAGSATATTKQKATKKAVAKKTKVKKKATKKKVAKKKVTKKKATKKKTSKKAKKTKKSVHAGTHKKAPAKTSTTTSAAVAAATGTLPALGTADLAAPVSAVTAAGRQTLVPLVAENDDQATGAVLYTHDWGPADLSAGWPLNAREIEMTNGIVTSVHDVQDTALPVGHSALVVNGNDASAVSWVQVGDKVAASSALIADATNTSAGLVLGGDALLLQAGTVQNYQCTLDADDSVRPRQVVGSRYGGTHLMVMTTDGDVRNDPGMTVREAAEVVNDLGWTDAMNDDGGNSAQQVVKKNGHLTLVNVNSQWIPRQVPDGLVITSH